MQDAVATDDVRRYPIADQQFHVVIYRAADSRAIFPIVESLWMQVGPFLNGVFTAAGTRAARDNHTQMLKVLLDEDLAKGPGSKGENGRAVTGRKLGKRTEELR